MSGHIHSLFKCSGYISLAKTLCLLRLSVQKVWEITESESEFQIRLSQF